MLQSTKLTVNNYIYIQYSDRKSDESLIVKNDFFFNFKGNNLWQWWKNWSIKI